MTYPRSPYDTLGGLIYFPRMLDKIRLKAKGNLSDSYFPFLGKGYDGRLCTFLDIDYNALVGKVDAGSTDEDILAWTQEAGRTLNEDLVIIWNGFATNRGRNDSGTPVLEGFKQECGLENRDEVDTFLEFIEIDEERAD